MDLRAPLTSILLFASLLVAGDAHARCKVVIFGHTEGNHQEQAETILKSAAKLGCETKWIAAEVADGGKAFSDFVAGLGPKDRLSVVQIGHMVDNLQENPLDSHVRIGRSELTWREFLKRFPADVPTEVQSSTCHPVTNHVLLAALREDPARWKNACGLTAVHQSDLHLALCRGGTGALLPFAWNERGRYRGPFTRLTSLRQWGRSFTRGQRSFYNDGYRNLAEGPQTTSDTLMELILDRPEKFCGKPIHYTSLSLYLDFQGLRAFASPELDAGGTCKLREDDLASTHDGLGRLLPMIDELSGSIERHLDGAPIITAAERARFQKILPELRRRIAESSSKLTQKELDDHLAELREYVQKNPTRDSSAQKAEQWRKTVECLRQDPECPCLKDQSCLLEFLETSDRAIPGFKVPDEAFAKAGDLLTQRMFDPAWIRKLASSGIPADLTKPMRRLATLAKNEPKPNEYAERYIEFLSALSREPHGLTRDLIDLLASVNEVEDIQRRVRVAIALKRGNCPAPIRMALIGALETLNRCENRPLTD